MDDATVGVVKSVEKKKSVAGQFAAESSIGQKRITRLKNCIGKIPLIFEITVFFENYFSPLALALCVINITLHAVVKSVNTV